MTHAGVNDHGGRRKWLLVGQVPHADLAGFEDMSTKEGMGWRIFRATRTHTAARTGRTCCVRPFATATVHVGSIENMNVALAKRKLYEAQELGLGGAVRAGQFVTTTGLQEKQKFARRRLTNM